MPDFRKWGLSPAVIYEYVEKVSKHNAKWDLGEDDIDGTVFKWCLYVGWLVCGGMGFLMGSEWGLVLGFLLLVGVFYLVTALIKYFKNKERASINSELIENYLEEYKKWYKKRFPYSI